jgi:glycosyltransferase involved in cell wall biosynthesis
MSEATRVDPTQVPHISIVTPSYNQEAFLEQTILSVLHQDYPDVEHIVIDGGSTDGSVRILRRYDRVLKYWSSGPDKGQADAINTGLSHATGEVIGIINSDDLYLPGALTAVGCYFANRPRSTWVCASTIMFGGGTPPYIPKVEVPRDLLRLLTWRYNAPQPGMFWRLPPERLRLETRWRYCFDHALYSRLLTEGERCEFFDLPIAGYRLHPKSKTRAESEGFEREFDQIAREYLPRLPWTWRRQVQAILYLRASLIEDRRSDLARGVAVWPAILRRRVFWGTLRRHLNPSLPR